MIAEAHVSFVINQRVPCHSQFFLEVRTWEGRVTCTVRRYVLRGDQLVAL